MSTFQVCYSELISRPVTFALKISAAPEGCRIFFKDVFYDGFLNWIYSIENVSWFVKKGNINNHEGVKSVLGTAYIKDCKGPDKECERKKKEFERKFGKANQTETEHEESLSSCLEIKGHIEEQLKNVTQITGKYNKLLKT